MNFLTQDYQRTNVKRTKPLLSGLDAKAHAFVGMKKRSKKKYCEILELAKKIDEQSFIWKDLTDDQLKEKIIFFKEIFRRRKKGYEDILAPALGAIREVADRHMGLRPYVVQLAGAIAMHKGFLVEMATGEGKTLTAGLTAVLEAWIGLPCHIITVNDYLASRDAQWLSPLYNFCDVSVGCVTSDMNPNLRKQGYHHDVTYTTSKEIVADFLRDRLWMGNLQKINKRQIASLLGRTANIEKGLVMRGIHTAIIDEADSVLIDEAVTPLIISKNRPNEPFIQACAEAHKIAYELEPDIDYDVDHKYNEIRFKTKIENRLKEKSLDMSDMSRYLSSRVELVEQALKAKEFFHKDKNYVVHDDRVVIVDEFTGRLMQQRTWQSGLHQLVEAKENLQMTQPSETLARLSFQRFFRFFEKISGMTGTAKEAAGELWQIYELPVMRIPENKPCQRKIYPRKIFLKEKDKWNSIVNEILFMHNQGRPVLVGTRSVKASENLAEQLSAKGISFRLLNALRHKEEAEIVAQAGQKHAITIATNMAGRGTDIRLGLGVAELGGLHVIATECHEDKRIDRQLFGRAARQGDAGSARSFVSMQDELINRYVSKPILKIIKTLVEREIKGSHWFAIRAIYLAQRNAKRLAFKRRSSVLRMDTWLDDSLSFSAGEIN